MKQKKNNTTVVNRRASYDYSLSEFLTVGIVLNGPEVRAARDGRVHLKGAFVTIKKGELWLNNASFSVKNNQPGQNNIAVDTRARKLLATKKQIANFDRQKTAGFTIVPTKMFTSDKHIKLEIALGKGKKQYDKRQTIKKREFERKTKAKLGGF